MNKFMAALSCTSALLFSSEIFCQYSCEARLHGYDGDRSTSTAYTLQLRSAGGGELYYFGARHLTEAADPQFSGIKKAWKDLQPTIAFFEGPDRGIAESDTATIKKLGESGYVRFLAKGSGVKTMSLEPPPVELFKYLVSQQDQRKVELYFLLGEAMRLRTRKEYTRDQIEGELTVMIGKMQALTGHSSLIRTISDLDSSFRLYWKEELHWWQAPQSWFDPAKTSKETGGLFTNDINKLSSSFRNVYMFQQLAAYTNKGERVFAVVGRDHVTAQGDALRCAIR
ncbi:MAG: hypothetical protein ABW007_22290 [Chitinophagaceae bacterium]